MIDSFRNLLIYSHNFAPSLCAFLFGLSAFAAYTDENRRGFWLRVCFLSVVFFVTFFAGFRVVEEVTFAPVDLVLPISFVALGLAVWLVWLREGQPRLDQLARKATRRTALAGNQKTDIRYIENFLPPVEAPFDPRKYFTPGKFFLGLNEGEPVFFERAVLPHVQITGSSGFGKGIAIASLTAQCVQAGEAVFILDPKDDEWQPHVLAKIARDAGKPFIMLDLRPEAPPQVNFFDDASQYEIEELFLGAFSLSEKGSDSDFYTIDDRACAWLVAKNFQAGDTPASLFNRYGADLEQKAKKFHGLLREMAELAPVNAKHGADLAKIVQDGGALYAIGSMRNAKVVRMQRMLLVKIIQLCERRDRTQGKSRPVCAVLDEAKYHISKPFLEALGAARDKGLHVIVAHQSFNDLLDVPADFNANAVVSSVMENCTLKIAYKVQDPKTAKWLAEKSGVIQVSDTVEFVTRNSALSEVVGGDHQIRQSERFLIDENMFSALNENQGALYGNGTASFITTSKIIVEKDPKILVPQAYEGDEVISAKDLI